MRLVLIAVAGGVGSLLRYGVAGWTQRLSGGSFPFGTFCANVIGCLLIGFLTAAFAGRWSIRPEYRTAILVGLLGGFTTFSSFSLETFNLLNDGQFARAVSNVVASLAAGLTATWFGYRLAQSWLGA